ncbi:hypothetical protein BDV25DRAFT_138889 [Aspergillus avenaceus]|uniref:NAD-dependent epimerase/dehydratase domain-containing protein n=1 Tax=Aspergillus avenaceus TaxID=36643 RepID=A0A5N6TYB3_ASPAV|nr:hypothetical protein BDV25DRAFT_138889 [Aspergillus avenaceus]
MAHNILFTGASGYLGGTGHQVKQYGAEPLVANLNDAEDIHARIVDLNITIVFFLVDAYTAKHQPSLIQALGQVKAKTGRDVHFLNTTGAKQFSWHAGMPTDAPLLDTNPDLYDLQRNAKSPRDFVDDPVKANGVVIDNAERHGVRSYIFALCLVYDRGEGFGNKTSIQDVSIVQAAQGARQVCAVDAGDPTWPVCHVVDTATLYLQILRKILAGEEIGYGNGYYLASSGPIAWRKVYSAFAKALFKRGVVRDDQPKQVQVLLGGKCLFTAEHGYQIGWKPEYSPEHMLEVADEEVEQILEGLQENKDKANIR